MRLVENIRQTKADTVVESTNRFKRSVCTSTTDEHSVEVQRNSLLKEEFEHWDCSISLRDSEADEVVLDTFRRAESLPGFLGDSSDDVQVWMPRAPVVRRYEGDHIQTETELEVGSSKSMSGLRIPLDGDETGRVEFSLVIVSTSSGLLNELREPAAIESRSVSKASWFDYDGISSLWDYFVTGQVYDPRSKGKGRWPCQQCAHTLSLHLLRIAKRTGKQIYQAFSELVAYSVASSLPEDGRWRHGVWTDRNETHARFQTDGIHLLVTYYTRTNDEFFLRAASRAMDYLISIADTLSNGELWFSHDSLEQSEDLHSEHYDWKPTTTVLGKSPPNTICLNTHVWTMTALRRLVDVTDDDEYLNKFECSLDSLHRVLSLDPLDRVYHVVNTIPDKITYNGKIPKPVKSLTLLASQVPLILLKSVYPRLVMPGGRIERDISHTARSDFYHLQNLKDLLILNSYIDDELVEQVVRRGVSYVERTSMIEQMLEDDRRVITYLDVLCFAAIQFGDNYANSMDEYLDKFECEGLPNSVDLLSFGPVLHESVQKQYVDLQEEFVLPRFKT